MECDDGYAGEDPLKCLIPKFCNLFDDDDMQEARYRARSRQETVNKRFKQFGCLRNKFRHEISNHIHCFNAIVVITQMNMEHGGEELFPVPYFTMQV